MTQVLMFVDTDVCEKFDLRDAPSDVAANIADIAAPLIEALQLVFCPATVAVILDVAAKSASYEAAVDAPHKDAVLRLQSIMLEQRELVRVAGREVAARPLTAELLW